MLKVFLGRYKDVVSDVSGYFDLVFIPNWLNNDFAKKVIWDIDKAEHVKDCYIKSDVFTAIAPRDLSSGTKGLLLAYNKPDMVLCGERFGDNCFKWLFELAKDRDITMTLSHILHLDYPFEMQILNTGTVVHNCAEMFDELMFCRDKDLITYDEVDLPT